MFRPIPNRLGLVVLAVLLAAPVGAEDLLGPGGFPPPAPVPKEEPQKPPADPALPAPPAPPPPAPVVEERVIPIPSPVQRSAPSAVQAVRTGSGVRIKTSKGGGMEMEDAFVEIEYWVDKGTWKSYTMNVKKGDRIGKVIPARIGQPERDCRTPWKLADIRMESRRIAKTRMVLVFDAQNNPVIGVDGKPVRKPETYHEERPVWVLRLEHLWAKDAEGNPRTGMIEEGSPIALPEISEDERPAVGAAKP